jgi:hypothetical protein
MTTRMSTTPPRKLLSVRVDPADIAALRRLAINIGPHVRALVKRAIRRKMKGGTTWKRETKSSS